MLEKAGQLSSMMQSISENLSMTNGETPSLVQNSNQVLKESRLNSNSSRSSRQQDPPGTNSDQNNYNRGSPNKEDRPTSSVNVVSSLEDDVSSVGSASLRFNSYNNHNGAPQKLVNASTFDASEGDDLFGESTPTIHREAFNPDFNNKDKDDDDGNNKEEETPAVQTSGEAPPSSSSSGNSVSMTFSPRDATPEGVQWEKVATATEGEDDYVPLVDYSHIKVANSKVAAKPSGSRLEQLRRRNARRRRRRLRAMLAFSLVVVAGFVYAKYFSAINEPAVSLEEEEEPSAIEDTRQMYEYDTSLMQHDVQDGSCFEAEQGDDSLLVTFPKLSTFVKQDNKEEQQPVVEEEEVVVVKKEKKPLFGLFGGKRKQQTK
jgi:hypothetical protein